MHSRNLTKKTNVQQKPKVSASESNEVGPVRAASVAVPRQFSPWTKRVDSSLGPESNTLWSRLRIIEFLFWSTRLVWTARVPAGSHLKK